jgi:hypothetical protein
MSHGAIFASWTCQPEDYRVTRRLFLAVLILIASSSAAFADAINLAWDPSTDPTVTGYRISFGTQPGVYTTTVDVGNRSSWRVTGLVDGLRYYFVVRAYNYFGLISDPSNEVDGVAVGLLTITSTAYGQSPPGVPITWTAHSGPGATLEYQFWRFSQSSGIWSIARPYSSSNTYTWTPQSGDVGAYSFQVWARIPGSSNGYDTWLGADPLTITNGVIRVDSLETETPLPVSTGTAITWKAKASGGPAPLQYRFWRQNQTTGAWTLAQDYGTSDTYSWTPTAGDLGRHTVQVWVRGAGSSASYDNWRGVEFEVRNTPPAVARLVSSVTFPAGTGAPITFTAEAAGGAGPLQYQFWRQSSTGWAMVRDYNTSPSFTWTPTAAGTYHVQVWMRRPGVSASYESFAGTGTFQVTDQTPRITSIVADAAMPLGVGIPVTWTVNAVGGPGQLEYKVYLYSSALDVWSVLRDYSTTKTFTWIPGAMDRGSYSIQVWVRRVGSSASQEGFSTAAVTVNGGAPNGPSLSSNVGLATRFGNPVTLTSKVAGGEGPLEYRFWRFSSTTGTWTSVQGYSWDRTLNWVPDITDIGSHIFQVWIRRTGTTASYETWTSANLTVTP